MENTQNIFEIAARNKIRFATPKGDITVEQLWDVPLRSRDDFNLDNIARASNRILKSATEESFVESKKTAVQGKLEIAFEIIKHIIGVKLDEEETAKKRAANKDEKEKLLKILAEKQDDKLSTLSENELKKRIAALSAE